MVVDQSKGIVGIGLLSIPPFPIVEGWGFFNKRKERNLIDEWRFAWLFCQNDKAALPKECLYYIKYISRRLYNTNRKVKPTSKQPFLTSVD